MGVHRAARHRRPEDVAKAEKWDELLDKKVSDTVKYEGDYVAVPVNIHRVNWLWINPEVFKKAGIAKTLPPLKNSMPPATSSRLPALFRSPTVASLGRTARCSKPGALGHGRGRLQKSLGRPRQRDPDRPGDGQGVDRAEKGRDLYGRRTARARTGTWKPPRSSTARPACRSWATGPKANGRPPENRRQGLRVRAFPGTDKAASPTTSTPWRCSNWQKTRPATIGRAATTWPKSCWSENFQYVFNQNKGSIPVRNDMLDMSKFDSCAQSLGQRLSRRMPSPAASCRAWRTTWPPRWRCRAPFLMW
jgi:glucose/mannose transport system substrate-binding protein